MGDLCKDWSDHNLITFEAGLTAVSREIQHWKSTDWRAYEDELRTKARDLYTPRIFTAKNLDRMTKEVTEIITKALDNHGKRGPRQPKQDDKAWHKDGELKG